MIPDVNRSLPVARGLAGDMRPIRKKVVIVSNSVPGHDLGSQHSGSARYLESFLDHFRSAEFEVVLIVLRPKVDFVCRAAETTHLTFVGPSFGRIGDWIILRSPVSIGRVIAWKLYVQLPRLLQAAIDSLRVSLRMTRGFAHTLGHFPSHHEVDFVRKVTAATNPDLVIYDGIFNSCGRVAPVQHWVITHDVKHQRAASFKRQGVKVLPASFNAETERSILEELRNIIAIQWDEAEEFKRLAPAARVVVVPLTMDLPRTGRRRPADVGRCLFVGSGSYHNYHGIRWFLDECWPKVREAMPVAKLDVVGSVCFRLSNAPPGVSFLGVVDNIDELYAGAAVAIIPLKIGSGLKVKLIEAFAYDQAIVTTSVGAQGLMHFRPRPFVIANSSSAFTQATIELLGSPSHQVALRSAATSCARSFSPQVAFSELDEAMADDSALA